LHTGNNTQNVTKLRSSPANPALPQRFYLRKRLNSLALQLNVTFCDMSCSWLRRAYPPGKHRRRHDSLRRARTGLSAPTDPEARTGAAAAGMARRRQAPAGSKI
jgi:hypothetical protein